MIFSFYWLFIFLFEQFSLKGTFHHRGSPELKPDFF